MILTIVVGREVVSDLCFINSMLGCVANLPSLLPIIIFYHVIVSVYMTIYSWHDDPVGSHSHVIRTPQANLLSHTKHLHSPKSSGPISYSKPEKSPESMSRSATYGSSKKSPGQVSSTPDAVSRTLTQPQSSAGVSSTSRPLTRRKWLETSIPGLIFGSVDDQLPTSTCELLCSCYDVNL